MIAVDASAVLEVLLNSPAAALADLADLPITRYPHGVLLPRIWALRGA